MPSNYALMLGFGANLELCQNVTYYWMTILYTTNVPRNV